jgi:hypothetical protein
MTKRTRGFVLAASAVVVAGIGTAGLASYVGLDRLALLGRQTADELSYLPQDVELLAYANIRDLMGSDVRHRLQAQSGVGNAPDDLATHTGVNIETDVDSVVVAVLPDSTASPETRAGGQMPLMLARGRFDRARIETLMIERGGVASELNGIWMVTSAEPDGSVAFLEPDLIAVGPGGTVRQLVEFQGTGAPTVRDNSEVMRLVQRVNHGNAWTVARFDALRSGPSLPANLASQLPALTWIAASSQIDSQIAATIHAEARDIEAAEDLGQVVRGFVALARMQAGQQPAFAQLIDSIQLTTEGTSVTIGFSVPQQVLDTIGALAPRGRVPSAYDPSTRDATSGASL